MGRGENVGSERPAAQCWLLTAHGTPRTVTYARRAQSNSHERVDVRIPREDDEEDSIPHELTPMRCHDAKRERHIQARLDTGGRVGVGAGVAKSTTAVAVVAAAISVPLSPACMG